MLYALCANYHKFYFFIFFILSFFFFFFAFVFNRNAVQAFKNIHHKLFNLAQAEFPSYCLVAIILKNCNYNSSHVWLAFHLLFLYHFFQYPTY